MNDFLKKTFAYDASLGEDSTDMVVSDQAMMCHVDDWGNEWEESVSHGADQDVAFLKTIANR